MFFFHPQAAEAAALGLAARAQKRKALSSVPLPSMATIGSSPILYTQTIATPGEDKLTLYMLSLPSKSLLVYAKMLLMYFLSQLHF